MEPQRKKPRKRRRRVLLAMLMFSVPVIWGLWPHGDARLVGKWGHTYQPGRPQFITTFYWYGVVQVNATRYRWWVEGDRIYRRRLYGQGGVNGMLADIWQELSERLTGQWRMQAMAGSRFVESGPNELTINNWNAATPTAWIRLPE